MKPLLAAVTLSSLMIYHAGAHAGIINGDFASCDFSGWQQDTDGFGPPGDTPDFTISNHAGNCSANLMVDDMATASAMFANTLYTSLDLTTVGDDVLSLSFDWTFSGTDGDPDFGDYFYVYLSDGSGDFYNADGASGFLIDPVSAYGGGSFNIDINSALYNQSGWTLEFQLFDAVSPTDEALTSILNIDNVQLVSRDAEVTAPTTGLLMSLCLLAGYRSRSRKMPAREI